MKKRRQRQARKAQLNLARSFPSGTPESSFADTLSQLTAPSNSSSGTDSELYFGVFKVMGLNIVVNSERFKTVVLLVFL